MQDRKRLALAGAGGWGRNIARCLRNLDSADFVAVCDPDQGALARLDLDLRTRRIVSLDALIGDPEIDALILATPSDTHHALARKALLAGKDLLVEKPLTLCPEEAAELVRIADGEGRILMVGHLLLYHPAIRKLRELLDQGEMGDIRYLYSQRVNFGIVRTRENALWSLAPHDVAISVDLLGEAPSTVTAQGAAYLQNGVEDVAFLQLAFPSGRLASFHVSWLDPHKERKITIVGSRKMAVFDDMEPTEKLRIYDRGVQVPEYLPYGEALSLRFGDVMIPHVPAAEPLRLECQHFVDRLHDRSRPLSDGRSGLQVVQILTAAGESLRRGGLPISTTN